MPKLCPEGKILNPLTNRCVSINGAIGKKLRKYVESTGSSMEQGTTLPSDIIQAIVDFLPGPTQNCGQLIRFLENTNARLTTTVQGQLQASVVRTLKVFLKRLHKTSLIRYAAIAPETKPMIRRIKETIHKASVTTSPHVLVEYCRNIVEWKQEARQIVEQLTLVIQYIDTYRRTKIAQSNYMGNLVVFGSEFVGNRHRIHRVNHWRNPNDPLFKPVVDRYYYAERNKVRRDQRALVEILKPVDINS